MITTYRDNYTWHEVPGVGSFYYRIAIQRRGSVLQWFDTTGRQEHLKIYVQDDMAAHRLMDQIIEAWTTGRTD